MRHAYLLLGTLALPVLALPIRMIEPSLGRLLVPPTRLAKRFAAPPHRARGRTIPMAVVAPAAQEEDLSAIPKYADYKAK